MEVYKKQIEDKKLQLISVKIKLQEQLKNVEDDLLRLDGMLQLINIIEEDKSNKNE